MEQPGAVAKRLGKNFIDIEKEEFYVKIATQRIEKIKPIKEELLNYKIESKPPKVPFGNLIGKGLGEIGEKIYDRDKKNFATEKSFENENEDKLNLDQFFLRKIKISILWNKRLETITIRQKNEVR